jgi:hypothetical protein
VIGRCFAAALDLTRHPQVGSPRETRLLERNRHPFSHLQRDGFRWFLSGNARVPKRNLLSRRGLRFARVPTRKESPASGTAQFALSDFLMRGGKANRDHCVPTFSAWILALKAQLAARSNQSASASCTIDVAVCVMSICSCSPLGGVH